jgi:DNA-directed RNA polymerase subunit RPC12/RpoP
MRTGSRWQPDGTYYNICELCGHVFKTNYSDNIICKKCGKKIIQKNKKILADARNYVRDGHYGGQEFI